MLINVKALFTNNLHVIGMRVLLFASYNIFEWIVFDLPMFYEERSWQADRADDCQSLFVSGLFGRLVQINFPEGARCALRNDRQTIVDDRCGQDFSGLLIIKIGSNPPMENTFLADLLWLPIGWCLFLYSRRYLSQFLSAVISLLNHSLRYDRKNFPTALKRSATFACSLSTGPAGVRKCNS